MSELQVKNYQEVPSDEWLKMANSDGLGLTLVKNGSFGADMLMFPAFGKTEPHTHPLSDHILFVAKGWGILRYGDSHCFHDEDLEEGTCYYVKGDLVHQILAMQNGLVLLSVSSNHQEVDSKLRMKVVSING